MRIQQCGIKRFLNNQINELFGEVMMGEQKAFV